MSNNFFLCISNIGILFILVISDMHKDLSKLKLKVQIEGRLIHIMN